MVLQRSQSGAPGWRRKVLVLLCLASVSVLVTMCRGVSSANDQVSSKQSKAETNNSRITIRNTPNLYHTQDPISGSSVAQSEAKHGSPSSRGSEFHEAEASAEGRVLENRSRQAAPGDARPGGESDFGSIGFVKQSWSNATRSSRLQGYDTVPRIMLELFDSNVRNGENLIPYQADTVRYFPAAPVLNETGTEAADSRGYEGRPGQGNTSTQTFKFNFKLPKNERVRNLLLRLRASVQRKRTPAGFAGRVRVSVVRCPGHSGHAASGSANNIPSDGSNRPFYKNSSDISSDASSKMSSEWCSEVDVAWKDVYLHRHTWLEFSMGGALRHLNSTTLTLRISVDRTYPTAGDPGVLSVDSSSDVNLQPLLLLYSAQRTPPLPRTKRSLTEVDWEGFEDDLESEYDAPPSPDSDRSGRRAGRRRRAKNACKRKPLRVDFASIGWGDWVIAPSDYEAYQCSGKCFYPLASHLSPTKHAVIQTLMHSKSTERARRACCVPTKLGPISLLYMEGGVMTFKKEYGGMVALECGCR